MSFYNNISENLKTITILGATGSIGVQALEVLESIGDQFKIGFLTANKNIEILESQIKKFQPFGVAIKDREQYKEFKKNTSFKGEILCGEEGVIAAAENSDNNLVLSALVGFSGVLPTLKAIEKGIDIALANKETLVAAGSIITNSARKSGSKILAVDSEHSAILQSLVGENIDEIEKIILTASGGPFLNTPLDDFQNLTVKEALNHPNWSMGSKITIDSATMMNKGFEVIEAYWLFGLEVNQIEVVIHPESIIHSLVQFVDGSVKAQLGLPDMRIPISYALSYPRRLKFDFPRLKLSEIGQLNFYEPDFARFPCLEIAYSAIKQGGTAPAVVNAANEVAVECFLNEKIRFTDISDAISFALEKSDFIEQPDIDTLVAIDLETRLLTENYINSLLKL